MRESDIGVTSVTIKHLQIRPKGIIKMWQKKGSNMIVINVNTSPIKQLYESAIKTYEMKYSCDR